MTFRKALPAAMPRAFSVADAHLNGVTPGQLRNPAFGAPFFGARTAPGVNIDLHLKCLSLATRMPRGTVVSHTTAALIFGVPLPTRHNLDPVHVTSPAPERALRYRGAIGHSTMLGTGDVQVWEGVPVTSPERTWCDLATVLSLPDLVAAGDYLLCWKAPFTSIDRLSDAVERYPSRRGQSLLRRALPLLSSRSRSRPESLVRVALVESHLPDPIPNFGVHLELPRRDVEIDLAYPEFLVGLEYQGDHHREDRAQWRHDIRRGNDTVDSGWSMIFFTGDDLVDMPAVVGSVERRLRSRGWVDAR